MYFYTEDDLRVLYQKHKRVYARVELLDSSLVALEEMQGEVISGSIDADSDSDTRNTLSLTMVLKGEKTYIGEDTRIWLNKRVRVYVGYGDDKNGNILWYSQGVFCFVDSTYSISTTSITVDLELQDEMCLLNGTIDGYVGARQTEITSTEGSNMREIVISILKQLGGVANYIIDNIGAEYGDGIDSSTGHYYTELPYDLSYEAGATVYDMLCGIRDVYPNWEFYFDPDGVFCFRRVSSSESDPVILDADVFQKIVISENTATSFSNVANVSEVWGMSLESDTFYEPTRSGVVVDTYTITTTNWAPVNDMTIGMTMPYTSTSASFFEVIFVNTVTDEETGTETQIEGSVSYPLKMSADEIVGAGDLRAGSTYYFKYSESDVCFYYMGQSQIHAVAMECNFEPSSAKKSEYAAKYDTTTIEYVINPDSPFAVEKIGLVERVYSGSEYDNIYSDQLATQRAVYNNWLTTRLEETLTLTTIMVPWLGVSEKVSYASQLTGIQAEYIITKISKDLGSGTMEITMRKFYPLYPFEQ